MVVARLIPKPDTPRDAAQRSLTISFSEKNLWPLEAYGRGNMTYVLRVASAAAAPTIYCHRDRRNRRSGPTLDRRCR